MSEPRMYFLVNTSLKMGGKIAGQVGHAVSYLYQDLRKGLKIDYIEQWIRNKEPKIILKATQEEINYLLIHNVPPIIVRDCGLTQIAANSLTVIAYYPSPDMKEYLKTYKLMD